MIDNNSKCYMPFILDTVKICDDCGNFWYDYTIEGNENICCYCGSQGRDTGIKTSELIKQSDCIVYMYPRCEENDALVIRTREIYMTDPSRFDIDRFYHLHEEYLRRCRDRTEKIAPTDKGEPSVYQYKSFDTRTISRYAVNKLDTLMICDECGHMWDDYTLERNKGICCMCRGIGRDLGIRYYDVVTNGGSLYEISRTPENDKKVAATHMKYMKYPERFKINRYYKLRSEYISRCSKHTEDIRPTEVGGTPLQEYNPVQDFVNTFNAEIVKQGHANLQLGGKSDHIPDPYAPTCPTCSSKDVKKISSLSKATGAMAFGIFSKTARSQFVCKKCGYKW